MAFELGETYSGYKFLDVVRRSKSGVEYRVLNTWAQRLEILKALAQSAQDDLEQNERFLREMRVRARLIHPNIVTLFNAVELERHLVMTSELVEGPTLAERLQLGPLPWREAAALMRQALAAVGFAHLQRIVHRDISPDNIIITPEGTLKLANFALAKSSASPKLTQVGTVIGNLKYISPEQVKGVVEVDARSDLYSLGIVFYEMLCGRPPFDSQSQFELMAAQVNQTPRPPSASNPAVPQALDAVVLKSLAKDPAQRYQEAEEFDRAITEAAAPAPVVVAAPAQAAPPAHAEPFMAAEPERAVAAPAVAVLNPPPPIAAPLAAPPLPAPVFLTAAKYSTAAFPWLLYSSAAAVCVGVLLMVLWIAHG